MPQYTGTDDIDQMLSNAPVATQQSATAGTGTDDIDKMLSNAPVATQPNAPRYTGTADIDKMLSNAPVATQQAPSRAYGAPTPPANIRAITARMPAPDANPNALQLGRSAEGPDSMRVLPQGASVGGFLQNVPEDVLHTAFSVGPGLMAIGGGIGREIAAGGDTVAGGLARAIGNRKAAQGYDNSGMENAQFVGDMAKAMFGGDNGLVAHLARSVGYATSGAQGGGQEAENELKMSGSGVARETYQHPFQQYITVATLGEGLAFKGIAAAARFEDAAKAASAAGDMAAAAKLRAAAEAQRASAEATRAYTGANAFNKGTSAILKGLGKVGGPVHAAAYAKIPFYSKVADAATYGLSRAKVGLAQKQYCAQKTSDVANTAFSQSDQGQQVAAAMRDLFEHPEYKAPSGGTGAAPTPDPVTGRFSPSNLEHTTTSGVTRQFVGAQVDAFRNAVKAGMNPDDAAEAARSVTPQGGLSGTQAGVQSASPEGQTGQAPSSFPGEKNAEGTASEPAQASPVPTSPAETPIEALDRMIDSSRNAIAASDAALRGDRRTPVPPGTVRVPYNQMTPDQLRAQIDSVKAGNGNALQAANLDRLQSILAKKEMEGPTIRPAEETAVIPPTALSDDELMREHAITDVQNEVETQAGAPSAETQERLNGLDNEIVGREHGRANREEIEGNMSAYHRPDFFTQGSNAESGMHGGNPATLSALKNAPKGTGDTASLTGGYRPEELSTGMPPSGGGKLGQYAQMADANIRVAKMLNGSTDAHDIHLLAAKYGADPARIAQHVSDPSVSLSYGIPDEYMDRRLGDRRFDANRLPNASNAKTAQKSLGASNIAAYQELARSPIDPRTEQGASQVLNVSDRFGGDPKALVAALLSPNPEGELTYGHGIDAVRKYGDRRNFAIPGRLPIVNGHFIDPGNQSVGGSVGGRSAAATNEPVPNGNGQGLGNGVPGGPEPSGRRPVESRDQENVPGELSSTGGSQDTHPPAGRSPVGGNRELGEGSAGQPSGSVEPSEPSDVDRGRPAEPQRASGNPGENQNAEREPAVRATAASEGAAAEGGRQASERPELSRPAPITYITKGPVPSDLISAQMRGILMPHQAYMANQALTNFLVREEGGFLFADAPGSGKTMAVLATIERLRAHDVANGLTGNTLYVTKNQGLVNQVAADAVKLMGRGPGESLVNGITFATYGELRGNPEHFMHSWDTVVFDESHALAQLNEHKSSLQAHRIIKDMIERTTNRRVIYATATPFEHLWETRYLSRLGMWGTTGADLEDVARWNAWMKAHGVSIQQIVLDNGKSNTRYRFDGMVGHFLDIHQDIFGQGRGTRTVPTLAYPPNSKFTRIAMPDHLVDVYNDAIGHLYNMDDEAAETRWATAPGGYVSLPDVRGAASLTARRIMEDVKVEMAAHRAVEAYRQGWHPAVFFEYTSEYHVGGTPEFADRIEAEGDEARRQRMMAKSSVKKVKGPTSYERINASLARAGINLPLGSPVDRFKAIVDQELGAGSAEQMVAEYHGNVTEARAQRDKDAYNGNRKPILLSSVQKGGTGASFHDTVGNSPRYQIVTTVPWSAKGVLQVAGRTARLGGKSQVMLEWILANTSMEESMAGRVGAKLRQMGAAVDGLMSQPTDEELSAFEYLPEEDRPLYERIGSAPVSMTDGTHQIEGPARSPKEIVQIADASEPEPVNAELPSAVAAETAPAQPVAESPKPPGIKAIDAVKKLQRVPKEETPPINAQPKAQSPAPTPGDTAGLVVGKESVAYTAANTAVRFRYAVVPSDRVVTSHDPNTFFVNPSYLQDMQDREYSMPAERAKVDRIAQNPHPQELFISGNTYSGAPIVGPDLQVESGNGRSMGIKKAYKSGKADEYKRFVMDNAESIGLDPEKVARVSDPVLVRIRTAPIDQGPIQRADLAREMGKSAVNNLDPLRSAIADARLIDRLGIAYLIKPDDNGSMMAASNDQFRAKFLAGLPSQDNDAVTSNGRLLPAGELRIKNAVMAFAYPDTAMLEHVLLSNADGMRNIAAALLRAAPYVGTYERLSKLGGMFSIARQIGEAANVLRIVKEGKVASSVSNYFGEACLFDIEDRDDATRLIASYMESVGTRTRNIDAMLRKYYADATSIEEPFSEANPIGVEKPGPEAPVDLLKRTIASMNGSSDGDQLGMTLNAGIPIDQFVKGAKVVAKRVSKALLAPIDHTQALQREAAMSAYIETDDLKKQGAILKDLQASQGLSDAWMKKFMGLGEQSRALFRQMGADLVDTGVMSKETFASHSGAYLHQIYRFFENPEQFCKDLDDYIASEVAARGMTPEEAQAYREIEQGKVQAYRLSLQKQGNAVSKGDPANQGPLHRNVTRVRVASEETQAYLGRINEASTRVAVGAARSARMIAKAQLYRNLAERYALSGTDAEIQAALGRDIEANRAHLGRFAGSSYVRVPNKSGYYALEGRFMPKSIWQEVQSQRKAEESWEGPLQRVMRAWKLAFTAYNPGTFMANGVGYGMLSDVAGGFPMWAAPRMTWETITDLRKNGPWSQDAAKHADYFKDARDRGDLNRFVKEAYPANQWAKLKYGTQAAFRSPTWIYTQHDLFFKHRLYIAARKGVLSGGRKMTPGEANQLVENTFPNWRKGTPVVGVATPLGVLPVRRMVQSARVWAVPFISWDASIVPILYKAFKDHPGRIGKYLWLATAYHAAVASARQESQEEQYNNERSLPDWEKDAGYFDTGYNTSDGLPLYLSPGGANLFTTFTSADDPTSAAFQRLNFVATTMGELAFNEDLMTHDVIRKPGMTNQEKLEADAQEVSQGILPPLAPGGYDFKRIAQGVGGYEADKTSKRMAGTAERVGKITQALTHTGVRAEDLDEDRRFTIRALIKDERGALRTAGKDTAKDAAIRALFASMKPPPVVPTK
nr:strawberry notch family protein [uncultured Rhodopila sp.]